MLRPRLRLGPAVTTVETPDPGNALPPVDRLHGALVTTIPTMEDLEVRALLGPANAAVVTTTRSTRTTVRATTIIRAKVTTTIATAIATVTATTAATMAKDMDRAMGLPLALEHPLALPHGISLPLVHTVATLDTVVMATAAPPERVPRARPPVLTRAVRHLA